MVHKLDQKRRKIHRKNKLDRVQCNARIYPSEWQIDITLSISFVQRFYIETCQKIVMLFFSSNPNWRLMFFLLMSLCAQADTENDDRCEKENILVHLHTEFPAPKLCCCEFHLNIHRNITLCVRAYTPQPHNLFNNGR